MKLKLMLAVGVVAIFAVSGALMYRRSIDRRYISPAPSPSLQDSCEQIGGEWVRGALRPQCWKEGEILTLQDVETPRWGVSGGDADDAGTLRDVETPRRGVSTGEIDAPSATPDFSSWPEASRYRTAINRAFDRGANFGTDLVLASWGCPPSGRCYGVAVISVVDGKVLFYENELRDFEADWEAGSLRILRDDGEGWESLEF